MTALASSDSRCPYLFLPWSIARKCLRGLSHFLSHTIPGCWRSSWSHHQRRGSTPQAAPGSVDEGLSKACRQEPRRERRRTSKPSFSALLEEQRRESPTPSRLAS
jgi:hypothetical protein